MKKILLSCLLLGVVFSSVLAQTSSPKREMRSGWLATVWKIDWPSYTVTSSADAANILRQKNQMISILDQMKKANANTVFFQVRSRCDAMYQSSYEPWSSDLVSSRGIDPGYDPLQFVIEEAHKRGMEVHPWLNPYRYESVAGQWTGDNEYRKTNPDWLLQVGDAVILNPGLPQVKQRISDIVAEIVTNYDVDGIVFDDYFYLQGISTQDAATAAEYNTTGLSLGDWRRENVNQMIADVHARIKSIKPYVQFGVSPAGVWDGGATVAAKYGVKLPTGVSSSGYQYNGIYCDPLAWMQAKTVDYISPQIYWPTTHATAPYKPLSDWWSYVANFFGVQFYSSHSLTGVSGIPVPTKSAVDESSETDIFEQYGSMSQLEKQLMTSSNGVSLRATNASASDYLLQVQANREYDKNGAPGSVFYSVSSLITTNLPEYLKANVFQNPALRPALWSQNGQEEFVSNVRIDGSLLKWDYSGVYPKFTVYAIPNSEVSKAGNFAKSDYLVDIVYSSTSIEIPASKPASGYTYAVAVFDQYNKEYSPVLVGNNTIGVGSGTVLEYPINNGGVVLPGKFVWQAQADAEFYILEVAEDNAFSKIIYRKEVSEASMSGEYLNMLKTGVDYYWRVTTRRISTKDAVSSIYKFTPTFFSVTYPAADEETTITPTITWTNITDVEKFKVEIATNSNMVNGLVFSREVTAGTSCPIEEGYLFYATKYFVRVTAILTSGSEFKTDVLPFSTIEVVPPVPVITTPENGASLSGASLNVKWVGSEYASRYEVALSSSSTFPVRNTLVNFTSAYTYETIFNDLESVTYYLRARALYGSKTTAWSDVVKISLNPSSIDEELNNIEDSYVYIEGGNAYLSLTLSENQPVYIDIYDMSGKKLYQSSDEYVSGGQSQAFLLSGYNSLIKGAYVVRISAGPRILNIKMLK